MNLDDFDFEECYEDNKDLLSKLDDERFITVGILVHLDVKIRGLIEGDVSVAEVDKILGTLIRLHEGKTDES